MTEPKNISALRNHLPSLTLVFNTHEIHFSGHEQCFLLHANWEIPRFSQILADRKASCPRRRDTVDWNVRGAGLCQVRVKSTGDAKTYGFFHTLQAQVFRRRIWAMKACT